MRVAEHLFEIGLAHILAIVGLVASLFVWRASDIGKTVGRVRQAWNARCAGANLVGRHETSAWMSLCQLGLWIVALGGCVLVITSMFSFLRLMATLYEVADRTDVSLLETLGRRANAIRDNIVISGLVISTLLVLEWIVGLGVEASAVKDGSAASAHLFSIPRGWRDEPAEMWRQRLRAVSPACGTISEDWRTRWDAWIEVVSAVRDA